MIRPYIERRDQDPTKLLLAAVFPGPIMKHVEKPSRAVSTWLSKHWDEEDASVVYRVLLWLWYWSLHAPTHWLGRQPRIRFRR